MKEPEIKFDCYNHEDIQAVLELLRETTENISVGLTVYHPKVLARAVLVLGYETQLVSLFDFDSHDGVPIQTFSAYHPDMSDWALMVWGSMHLLKGFA